MLVISLIALFGLAVIVAVLARTSKTELSIPVRNYNLERL